MARHGYVRLQVQYSCTEKWSMARTDRSPRDSRCDVSMGGGDGETPALDRVSRVHRAQWHGRRTGRWCGAWRGRDLNTTLCFS